MTDLRSRLAGPVTRHDGTRLLVIGIIDVIAGVLALAWPGVTIVVLGVLFGVLLLVAGIAMLGVGGVARRYGAGPVVSFLFGIIAIVGGLICLFHPGVGIYAIAVGCALWFLFTGIGYLTGAGAPGAHRPWLIVSGVLSIIAALILFFSPGIAIVTVALLAGIGFVVRGAAEISSGLRLRRLGA